MTKIDQLSMQTQGTIEMKTEWFKEWFNSPFYHILYKNRDEGEARQFIDRLLEELQPPSGAKILDLACGKGRYSRYLAAKGFEVTGLDIAEESILFAQQFETEHLTFFTHDMRLPYRIDFFDYIFNFFTSFGYFECEEDHAKTVNNIAKGLKEEGRFVLDFFNSKKVIRLLKPKEVKRIDGIEFLIQKKLDAEGYIVKNIDFQKDGEKFSYVERVRAFSLEDFETLFRNAGLKIAKTFGDYHLNPFDEMESDRLILVGCKSGC